MGDDFQLRQLRLRADLRARLRPVRDARKAVIHGIRATRESFDVGESAVATLRPGRETTNVIYSSPRGSEWDAGLLSAYLRGRRPEIPEHTLLAPVERRGRNWAVLALRDVERGSFSAEHVQALFAVTQILTEIVRAVDEARLREVRRKIELKIADHQEPKDLIYDILHGIRSLTRYDHSSALLIAGEGGGAAELVAEQIAWTKAKSKRIGRRVELDDALLAGLGLDDVRLYERVGKQWVRCPEGSSAPLPALLDWDTGTAPEVSTPVSMVCAPIATSRETLGVLKIAARRHGVLGDYEVDLVREFMPLAVLAIQFSMRTESLREQMLRSERKHALANMTRGITHDVNNALGAMLPLVQQLRADACDGEIETDTLTEDLRHIEGSIQTCRRIFGGMLAVARGSSRTVGHGNLRRAIEGALSVLEDSLKRRDVTVRVDLPQELPTVRGGQGDLTQLFLNFCSNSRDAMSGGGALTITARTDTDAVTVTIEDTGCGIPPEAVDRVPEPFFTTKSDGNGLGLSICRSILWDVGGAMKIDSEVGRGTRLSVELPILDLPVGDGAS